MLVDSFNVELRDGEAFLGDRASSGAFFEILADLRQSLRARGDDPLGEDDIDEFGKAELDAILLGDDLEAAALVQAAIERFASELFAVIRRFLQRDDWKGTERIVVGGGFRRGRIGELAIGRAEIALKEDGTRIELVPISHHPDEAALVGAAHLAPAQLLKGHNAILGVDIGGSNIRAGVVRIGSKKKPDPARAKVIRKMHWRYAEDAPDRDEAVERLIDMLRRLIDCAEKEGLTLAPLIGIGCPGLIEEDGRIARGGQNLPGDWESSRFNLPEVLRRSIPEIAGRQTTVLMHNDAVVQGLSEAPAMADIRRWGVLTIGTGLGNARFTNRMAD